MRHTIDPQQKRLFDSFQTIIPPLGLKRIQSGWQAICRFVLLSLMPVRQLGSHFDPVRGRPTKELYSVAGLLFLQEAFNWTNAQAVDAYLFRTDVQLALNLEPGVDEMCDRTLERYRKLFINDDLAAQVMTDVTNLLVKELELEIDQQRLDSTHVFSNMASFGRTRMMGVTIKRFLTQVLRHYPDDFDALPEELRQRYAPSQGKLFAKESQNTEQRAKTKQQVAQDMRDLIDRFADHDDLNTRPSYQALLTVFEQQCEIVDDKVKVRAKTGGNCVQNPSDMDATYDGHKGQGYKLQVVETCSPNNEVQLIVAALPETAVQPDAAAVAPILAELQKNACLPESMLADTAFGSDENVQKAAALGVELVSPVAGPAATPSAPSSDPKSAGAASEPACATLTTSAPEVESPASTPAPVMEKLTMEDFAVDERTGKVGACPAGRIPLQVLYDAETTKTTIEMDKEHCQHCPFREACPIEEKANGKFTTSYTDKQRRLEERRREQDTAPFQKRYEQRSGLESTNSGLKRRLGVGRLRVRGGKAVKHALCLKVAGWNLLRAAASGKLAKKMAEAMAQMGLARCFQVLRGRLKRIYTLSRFFPAPLTRLWQADI
jgi:hypothetical protein